jgi:exodeoxyribonuclease VII large subunit
MIHRIRQRFPRDILLWPVTVQGEAAAGQISEAIKGMNLLSAEQKPDVLIVARGGGSFEDLMPFNEEIVVRAIAESGIPIISAVGHETDTTLADYAADLRAPTPTAAAEFAVPEKITLRTNVDRAFSRLSSTVHSGLEKKRLFLRSNRILNIRGGVSEKIQRTDYVFDMLTSEIRNRVSKEKILSAKILVPKPIVKENGDRLLQNLRFIFYGELEKSKNKLMMTAGLLESNSYMRILKKGFALAESEKSVPIIRAEEAKKHDAFDLIFSDGRLKVRHAPSQSDLFSEIIR